MCLTRRSKPLRSCTPRWLWPGLTLGLALAGMQAAHAAAPAPLPVFSIQALDGSPVSTSTWALQGKSLLIYVEGNCQPCATLLGRLLKKDFPQIAAHTIIIVGGAGPAGAKSLQQLYPDLNSATWYADPARAALSALNLQGAPVTMGLNGKVVQWSWSGVMPDAARLRSVLNSWCGK